MWLRGDWNATHVAAMALMAMLFASTLAGLGLFGVIPGLFGIIGVVLGVWVLISWAYVMYWYDDELNDLVFRVLILPLVISSFVSLNIPAWLLGTVSALLKGDDRLRAIVFGTGLVLLFGGLTMQLIATY